MLISGCGNESTRDIENNQNMLPRAESVIFGGDHSLTRSSETMASKAQWIEEKEFLPVYKINHLSNGDNVFKNIVENYDIHVNQEGLSSRKLKSNVGKECLFIYELNDKEQNSIEINVYSNGCYIISVDKFNDSSNDLNFNMPLTKNEEEILDYAISYISANNELFNINAEDISVDVLLRDGENNIISYSITIRDNVPSEKTEDFYYYNDGDYKCVSILVLNNEKLMISYIDRKNVTLIDTYPIINFEEALGNYRKGDFICYDSQTKEALADNNSKLDCKYSDECIGFDLIYTCDENDILRPIYKLLYKTESGVKYNVAVDAIKYD